MIDEKKLIADMEKLPFIHGRYDKKNANPHFISGVESMYEMIKELIKSQPKVGEWIPCSERLPEVGEYILGTNEYDEVLIYHYAWNSPHTKKKFFYLCGAATTIKAWQPLPEPWEGEK